ncbi:MAG: alpha/beta fold hydrolase [Chlorobiales bacterium]|jgi:pimeloyl-ACP methyl ester carboxylesterase|nr:alpha/beta fold hydrolase [Chlorobiales bacterium]
MSKDVFFDWSYEPGKSAKIRYQEYGGPSDQTPMLFIHGYGAMIEHWNQNIPEFERDHTIYAMDLMGFGGSQKPNAHYSLELWSKQIDAFLEHKGLDRIILIGHSMGGATSLWFANRRPEKIKALVIVDPSGIFADNVGDFERVLYKLVGTPIIGDVMFGLFANSFGARQSLVPTYYDQSKVTEELVEQFAKPLRDEGANWSYLSPSRRPNEFLLEKLGRPCNFQGEALIVWGEFDKGLPPLKLVPEFKKLLPHADVQIIPGASHCAQHDAPEEFNRALRKFLTKVEIEKRSSVGVKS